MDCSLAFSRREDIRATEKDKVSGAAGNTAAPPPALLALSPPRGEQHPHTPPVRVPSVTHRWRCTRVSALVTSSWPRWYPLFALGSVLWDSGSVQGGLSLNPPPAQISLGDAQSNYLLSTAENELGVVVARSEAGRDQELLRQRPEPAASSLPRPAEPGVPWVDTQGCRGWETPGEGEQPPDRQCPQGCRWCPSAGVRCSAPRHTPRISARWPACSPSSCRPSGLLGPQPAPPGAAGALQGLGCGQRVPPGSSVRERLGRQGGFYISAVGNKSFSESSAWFLSRGVAPAASSPADLAAAMSCGVQGSGNGRGRGHQEDLRPVLTAQGAAALIPGLLSPQAMPASRACGARGAPHPRASKAQLSSGESLCCDCRALLCSPSTLCGCKAPATAAWQPRGGAGKEAGGKAGAPRGPAV